MRRFAKPLYELKLVPGVRIPPSPPDLYFQWVGLLPKAFPENPSQLSIEKQRILMAIKFSVYKYCRTDAAHLWFKQQFGFAASAAERFEQAFFLFLGELGERVEGSKITGQSGGGKSSEGFGREPRIACPAAGKKNHGTDATKDDLHAKKH